MKNSRIELIAKPLFILGLLLLLLNDFYFKYQYSNFLTGKISDVAGLFIFPYFFSSLNPKMRKSIYWYTAFLFIFWKSSYSQEIINWFQSVGIGMNRTVDYSDLIALFILPISFVYFTKQLKEKLTGPVTKNSLKIIISCVSLFAFWGTTLPSRKVDINIASGKQFKLEMSKSDFFKLLKEDKSNKRSLTETMNDSLYKMTFYVDSIDLEVTVKATINSRNSKLLFVQLDSLLFGYTKGRLFSGVDQEKIQKINSINVKEYENYFDQIIIEAIIAKDLAITESKRKQKAKQNH